MPSRARLGWAIGFLALLVVACAPVEETAGGEAPADQPVAADDPTTTVDSAAEEPRLGLPPDAVEQGGELSVEGEGFAADEVVIFTATGAPDEEHDEVGRLRADEEGRIHQAALALPEWVTSGERQIVAVGERSGRRAEATFFVRARDRWLKVDRYALRPRERLGFIAGGFVPEEQVQVYFGGDGTAPSGPLTTIAADRAGNTAWTEVPVPLVPEGKHTLRLVGSEGDVRETIEVEPFRPTVELSPWSGPPGSQVDVHAHGFAPGEPIHIFVDGVSQPSATAETDAWGNAWGVGPVGVPTGHAGEGIAVVAEGQESGARAMAVFAVHGGPPWVELSAYAGYPGTVITLSGGGFGARESVRVHLNDRGGPAVAAGVTTESGHFRNVGPVAVPPDARGRVTFVVVGEGSGGEATASFQVLELPRPEIPRR